jgi:hypothetical protein
MTTAHKWTAVGCAFLVLLLGAAAYQIHKQDKSVAAAQAASDARNDQAKADQKVVDEAVKHQEQTADLLKSALATIDKERKTPVTPQQAAAVANSLPGLPLPVQVQQVPATATTPAFQQIIIPQVDIPAFQKYKLDCDESNARLLACSRDSVDFKSELDVTKQQYDLMTADRNNWKTVATGGTFWHKVGAATKHIGCGLAGGAVGIETSNKSTPLNGGIAAVGATGGCELIFWLVGKIRK